MNPETIWSATLGELELQMTQATFDTWLRDSRLLKIEDDVFVVGVTSGYAKEWLEHRLLSTVKRTLARQVGRTVEVAFIVASDPPHQREDVSLLDLPTPALAPAPALVPANLNPRYTFERFVVGPGNRLAHAAPMAVTETPGGAYNPLFIYGGVGLGKTHLLQAIGHYVLTHKQLARVMYVSSEKFTNDLINSIRDDKTVEFRNKYRTADVLLIDDIQFLAGKERTPVGHRLASHDLLGRFSAARVEGELDRGQLAPGGYVVGDLHPARIPFRVDLRGLGFDVDGGARRGRVP